MHVIFFINIDVVIFEWCGFKNRCTVLVLSDYFPVNCVMFLFLLFQPTASKCLTDMKACIKSELCLIFGYYKTCWRHSKWLLQSELYLFYRIKFIHLIIFKLHVTQKMTCFSKTLHSAVRNLKVIFLFIFYLEMGVVLMHNFFFYCLLQQQKIIKPMKIQILL